MAFNKGLCLTVKQSWASLICPPQWFQEHINQYKHMIGRLPVLPKDIENRTWASRWRGLLFIHAGKSWDRRAPAPALENTLPRQAIIGAVVLVGMYRRSASPWHERDMIGWGLRHPVAFDEPVYCRGFQGLWKPEQAGIGTKELLKLLPKNWPPAVKN